MNTQNLSHRFCRFGLTVMMGVILGMVFSPLIGVCAAESDAPFPAAVFSTQVRPLLVARCISCHGPEVQEGGLRLDLRRRALLGGDSGPVIVALRSESSELITRLTTTDLTKQMPQGGEPLSVTEIELLKNWIDTGAVWPEEFAGTEQQSDHWSFRPMTLPQVPASSREHASRHPVDRFVLARLEQEGLQPAVEASRATLIRRLSLDLLGLPPLPEQVETFVNDRRAEAYEELVDRLLDSKHFGER